MDIGDLAGWVRDDGFRRQSSGSGRLRSEPIGADNPGTVNPTPTPWRDALAALPARAAAAGREVLETLFPADPPPGVAEQAAALEQRLAATLAGAAPAADLAAEASAAEPDAFWAAVERVAEGVAGDAWERLGDPGPVAIERRRLRHLSAWARALAARRLGLIHDHASAPLLRRVMERGPAITTLAAALALARLGDRPALDWLLEHPAATARFGRHQLVALLKRFGPAATPALAAAVEERGAAAAIHLAAVEVLGLRGERAALGSLLRLLVEGGAEARVAAARALGGLGERAAIPLLIEALDDYEWAVRVQAARALGALGAVEAAPRLAARLNDRVWWVRDRAALALAALGGEGRRALEAAARSSRDRYAADMAAEALEGLAAEPREASRVA